MTATSKGGHSPQIGISSGVYPFVVKVDNTMPPSDRAFFGSKGMPTHKRVVSLT